MRYRLFQYPLPAPPELEDLNRFIATQRVATVAQHLVPTAGGALLVFVVETVGSSPATPFASPAPKVDYRDQLNAAQFAVFSRLRAERKRWAEAEGLPVYAIFTNSQLAEMVKRNVRTSAELGGIEGVGPARLDKYGTRLLAVLGDVPVDAAPKEATP